MNTLRIYGIKHPDAKTALDAWARKVKAGHWTSMNDVQGTFPKVKALNGDRARFSISGGDYRLIAAFDFKHMIVFVKFIGTHAEYDKVDALTVSHF